MAGWPPVPLGSNIDNAYLPNLGDDIMKVAESLKFEPLSSKEYINLAAEGHLEELLDDAGLIAFAQVRICGKLKTTDALESVIQRDLHSK